MNKKAKRITVGLVAVLCFLLVFALGFGITGAWYEARRTATGTVTLDQGIVLNYKGFNPAATELKPWTNEANLKLFADISGVPNKTIDVADASIAKGTVANGSVIDFVVRAKLAYTYYVYADASRTTIVGKDAENGYTAADLKTKDGAAFTDAYVLKTALAFDTADWKMSGEYAYYTDGSADTLAYLPTTEVNLFSNDIVLEDWTAEFGGPLVKIGEATETSEIAKIVVTLTVEAVQPGAQTAWGINALPA